MSDEQQVQIGGGQIRFHSRCAPPLDPGDYLLTAEHDVPSLKLPKGDTPFSARLPFTVDGPRFALSPSDVYSVYPPKGHVGDFAETLPHIVFTRRTLPWERMLRPSTKTPWMALLVVSQADFPDRRFPEVTPHPIAKVRTPGADYVRPAFADEATGPEDELCNTLDLPGHVFSNIAPSEDDLAYLAHVREVNTGAKETSSLLADGWFSVIVANRMPDAATSATDGTPAENRVYLVSLEGLVDRLPHKDAPPLKEKVRLVVLASWSFRCRKAAGFKAAMTNLGVARLAVSGDDEDTEKGTAAAQYVRRAWAMGYTALNHGTRAGEKTVSWYRGPLIPMRLMPETNLEFRPAADAALRYSSGDGMMDVSYAAAYQLGRLLGLQDRHFAAALYGFRNRNRRRTNTGAALQRLRSDLGLSAGAAGTAPADEGAVMRAYLGTPKTDRPGNGTPARVNAPATAPPAPASSGHPATSPFDIGIPEPVSRWLARLMLLYRVPFAYLVPDQRMLPPDRIRFFHVDPNWLKCLLEGACSVGRSSAGDEETDKKLRDTFLNVALEGARDVRSRVKDPAPRTPSWPLTGFLLRSPVVEGWQGLEMRARTDGGKSLRPLRIDRLSPDIMLCIFDGSVQWIEIKQPPEGLHFGMTADGAAYRKSMVRQLDDGASIKPGEGKPLGTNRITAPMSGRGERVLDVTNLAAELANRLEKARRLTSAEFAVQMVETPGVVVFSRAPDAARAAR